MTNHKSSYEEAWNSIIVHSIFEIFKDREQGQHYLHLQQPTTSCKDEKGQHLHLQKIENELHKSITRTMPFAFVTITNKVTKINNKDNIICICKVQTIGALSFPFVKINKGIITM
jgi:hypothetical protein